MRPRKEVVVHRCPDYPNVCWVVVDKKRDRTHHKTKAKANKHAKTLL